MALRELPDLAWQRQAACKGSADVMFPPEGLRGSELNDALDRAREICAACTVQGDCLDWALNLPDHIEGGIVAGLSTSQLKAARGGQMVQVRRANRVAPCGTEAAYDAHVLAGETCEYCLDRHARKNARYAQAS